jgi:hypothetical protein
MCETYCLRPRLVEQFVATDMNQKLALSIFSVALAVCVDARAAEIDLSKLPPPSNRKDLAFDKDIHPIFEKSCVKCHGAEKPKAKLRLDSLQGVLDGADGGKVKVIKPGDSSKSELVHSIAQLGPDDHWMPPPKNKLKISPLTKEEVGLIRAWIDQGAK